MGFPSWLGLRHGIYLRIKKQRELQDSIFEQVSMRLIFEETEGTSFIKLKTNRMSRKIFTTCFLLLSIFTTSLFAQNSLAEKLGYDENTKLLIIHADDIGLAHSENLATFLALKIGMVSSGSIMMPCPWVAEVADFVKENPTADLGLHLTLTSEWKHMKWGSVAPLGKVSSLVDSLGFFYSDCLEFGQKAKVDEVEIELRAQIEKAFKMGIRPTHFDTHMGCLVYNSPEVFGVYLKLGREYKIPVMLSRFFLQAAPQEFKDLIQADDVILENVAMASPNDFESGMADYYKNFLMNLSPGVQMMLIHTAFDNAEMQAISVDHPLWGAKWRQEDFDFFTSETCREILEKENIKLITWREIQEMVYGK